MPQSARNAEADRLYQEAEHLAGSWELDKVTEAVERYQAALRLEPRLAQAWAGLTNADIVLTFIGPNPDRARADSETHARRALELDGSSAAAYAALGHSYWQQWRWNAADAAFQRAITFDEHDPVAHQLYGLYLASRGRGDVARQHAERALELAPTSGLLNYSLAQVYFQTGEFEAAATQAKRTLEMERHFPLAFPLLARAYAQLGQWDAAASALDSGERYAPDQTLAFWSDLADNIARTGAASLAFWFRRTCRAA
jgi:tetratricopeptide (TPR) repeat protein